MVSLWRWHVPDSLAAVSTCDNEDCLVLFAILMHLQIRKDSQAWDKESAGR
jgi:hypothetical protein